jgi:hypothetical protein
MTNDDVEQFIQLAASKCGRTVDSYKASTYLAARKILTNDPENIAAATVVNSFNEYLSTGVEKVSFASFLLPTPYTDEEIAASDRIRDDYLECYRKLSLVGIAEGDYIASRAFRARHGLTAEQILTMPDSQIKALARTEAA